MQNRQTLLLCIITLLLGINIGMMLSGKSEAPQWNVLPSAVAGSPVISSKNEIFTTSADGTKLYKWRPKAAGNVQDDPWSAIEYSK